MNLSNIAELCPKSFQEYIGSKNNIYDHFDNLNIIVCPEYRGKHWAVWVSEISWEHEEGLHLTNRRDAENAGFIIAFKIREKQLNEI